MLCLHFKTLYPQQLAENKAYVLKLQHEVKNKAYTRQAKTVATILQPPPVADREATTPDAPLVAQKEATAQEP